MMMEMSADQEAIDDFFDHMSKEIWIIPALKKRNEVSLTVEFSKPVLCFISILVEGIIGAGILYLYYMQYEARKRNFSKITMSELALIFPWGFWSKEALDQLWDLQKYDGGNIIDNTELCNDIQLK